MSDADDEATKGDDSEMLAGTYTSSSVNRSSRTKRRSVFADRAKINF